MQNSKSVSTPFSVGCKLSSKQCPGNEADLEDVSSTKLVGSRKSYVCHGVHLSFQFVVALSATEAEYMEATHACKEVIWLSKITWRVWGLSKESGNSLLQLEHYTISKESSISCSYKAHWCSVSVWSWHCGRREGLYVEDSYQRQYCWYDDYACHKGEDCLVQDISPGCCHMMVGDVRAEDHQVFFILLKKLVFKRENVMESLSWLSIL